MTLGLLPSNTVFLDDGSQEPSPKPPTMRSRTPCPVCGNRKWIAYFRQTNGLLEVIDTKHAVIDFSNALRYGTDYDECVNCHTVVS